MSGIEPWYGKPEARSEGWRPITQFTDVEKYADGKPTREQLISEMKDEGFSERWLDLCLQYVKRAQLLGAETPQGRQVMGKAIVSLMHILETATMVYGPMPEPGHPSGEIR